MSRSLPVRTIAPFVALAAATAALLVWQQQGMNHRTTVFPTPGVAVQLFGDGINGGASEQSLEQQDDHLAFACRTVNTGRTHAFCGMVFSGADATAGAGYDISRYDTLEVDITVDSDAPDTLMFYLLNDGGSADGALTERAHLRTVVPGTGPRHYRLPIDTFHVPSWWLMQNPDDVLDGGADFSNIVAMRITTGDSTVERRTRMRVERIELSGKWISREDLSLVLASIWFGVLGSVAVRAAHRLRRRARTADQQTAAKTAFLARMSHEIRTPMNGVLGMSELLRGTPLSGLQQRYNDIIHSSATALLRIINDLLDLSKVEAGKLELEVVPFRVDAFLAEIRLLFSGLAQDRGVALVCRTDGEVPAALMGDPGRLQQVVVNLVNNAFRFTRQGQVTVTLSRPRDGQLRIAVADTGAGIAAGDQARLFEAFAQAAPSTAREHGGTGLGLTICAELAELMGGSIRVDSAPGAGATFTVDLPLVAADPVVAPVPVDEAPPAAALAAAAGARLDVLVAEDNAVNQMVVRGMLQKLGHRVQLVADGAAAVTVALERHGDLDAVLMDCDMPVMDGLEATRRIRAWEAERGAGRLPVVAVTAHALADWEARCMAAGMDRHLAKPITAAALQEALAAVVADDAANAAG